MLLRFLLFLSVLGVLNAQEELYSKTIHPNIEAGMHFSKFDGSISNANSTSDIKENLNYTNSTSSYLALGVWADYKYAPNIKIDYFSHTQNQNSGHNTTIYIADGVFDANTTITTQTNYTVANFTIYHDFQYKGSNINFLRWSFYPGDIEYYMGLNIKYIRWRFDVEKATNATTKHWIEITEIIPLPFIGFQYFYKNFRAFANVSALSFKIAKSTNYEIGFAYQVFPNLYINASYLYEDFQVTERAADHIDTIKFLTSGNKFSFKYIF